MFQSICYYKIDHILRTASGEQHSKRRPEDLVTKNTNIKNALNHYDNLRTDQQSLSLLSTLQYLSKLWNHKK